MSRKSSAVAALAAVAFSFSVGATAASQTDRVAAKRAAIMAAKNAAKAGDGARLGASLAVLEKASARRVAQSDVTHRVTRKNPALRASDGYVAVSAYGNDLGALRAQLVAKGLIGAKQHDTAVSGRAPVAALADMAATPGLKFL